MFVVMNVIFIAMHEQLTDLIVRFRESEGNLITLLQDTQEVFGYVPQEAVYWFANELDVPASRFFGIATFYAQFHLKPRGKNIVTACCGTACHVRGAERLVNAVKRELKLEEDQDTTEDRLVTVEKLACLGTCSLAPVVIINGKMFGKATTDILTREIRSLKKESKKNE
jgi:NADH:ubiquinone oxidoreductase subunit E